MSQQIFYIDPLDDLNKARELLKKLKTKWFWYYLKKTPFLKILKTSLS